MVENTKEEMIDLMPESLQECVSDDFSQNEEATEQKITEAIGMLLQDVEHAAVLEEPEELEDLGIDVENIISSHRLSVLEMVNEESAIFVKTDKQFLDFLTKFVGLQDKKERQKLVFKTWFFVVVMLGFFALIITPLILILFMKNLGQTTAIVSMITVLIELVSAIIVLPKIIAEYLFNKKEDEKLMQIIETMQTYNIKRHAYIKKITDEN